MDRSLWRSVVRGVISLVLLLVLTCGLLGGAAAWRILPPPQGVIHIGSRELSAEVNSGACARRKGSCPDALRGPLPEVYAVWLYTIQDEPGSTTVTGRQLIAIPLAPEAP